MAEFTADVGQIISFVNFLKGEKRKTELVKRAEGLGIDPTLTEGMDENTLRKTVMELDPDVQAAQIKAREVPAQALMKSLAGVKKKVPVPQEELTQSPFLPGTEVTQQQQVIPQEKIDIIGALVRGFGGSPEKLIGVQGMQEALGLGGKPTAGTFESVIKDPESQTGYSKMSTTGQKIMNVPPPTSETKLPIQSDERISAMATLGFNPMDPASFTPENIAKSDKLIREQRIADAAEVAKRQKQERTDIEQATPYTPSQLHYLRNPETLEPAPVGITPSQAKQQGYIPVNQKAVDDLFALDNSGVIIQDLTTLADRLITAENPIGAGTQFATLEAGARLSANSEAAVYKAQKASFIGNLSRTMAAERGVLTEGDIQRISNGFPSFGDTRQIKDMKLAVINDIYNIAKLGAKRKIVGMKSGEEKQYKTRLKTMLDNLDAIKKGGKPTTKAAPVKATQPTAKVLTYNPSTGGFE